MALFVLELPSLLQHECVYRYSICVNPVIGPGHGLDHLDGHVDDQHQPLSGRIKHGFW